MRLLAATGGGSAPHPALALLENATLWLDAAFSVEGEQEAVNQGAGGSILNALYGGEPSINSNDPKLLAHTGDNYVYLPGVAGNWVTVPDSPSLSPTGSIELIVRCQLPSWTPSTDYESLIGKWNDALPGNFMLFARTSGRLTYMDADKYMGPGLADAVDSSTLSLSDNVPYWLKVSHDTDTGLVTFEYAADQEDEPSVWTSAGSSGSNAGERSVASSPISIGGRDSGNFATRGKFFRGIIRSNGVTVLDINPATDITYTDHDSFTATTGQTVTVNHSSGTYTAALVTRPTWMFSGDFLSIPDNALLNFSTTESFTAFAVVRAHGSTVYGTVFEKGTGGGASRYNLGWNASTLQAAVSLGSGAGTTSVSSTAFPASSLNLHGLVRDVTTDSVSIFKNGVPATTADNTTTPLASGGAFKIGAGPDGWYLNGEVQAVVVDRRSWTQEEIAAVCSFYGIPATPTPFQVNWHAAVWADDPRWENPGDGNLVDSWRDGASSNTPVQPAPSAQPTFYSSVALLNGHAAVAFDGDALGSPSFAPQASPTLVWIGHLDHPWASNNARLLDVNDAPSYTSLFLSADTGGKWCMYCVEGFRPSTVSHENTQAHAIRARYASGSGSLISVDGVETAFTTAAGDQASRFLLGAANMLAGDASNNHTAFAGLFIGDVTTDPAWPAFVAWVFDYYGLTIS